MAENMFTLQIISPDRVFYEGEAKMVELVTSEGEIGVYQGHIPMTYVLKPGVVYITEANETKKAALHEGFIEILPNKIVILAEIAEWPDEIDKDRADKALHRAEERLKRKEESMDTLRAEMALKRAMVRLELLK